MIRACLIGAADLMVNIKLFFLVSTPANADLFTK
jgi:hypothetical protein